MTSQPTFEDYHQIWIQDIIDGDPSTTALGHRFARKLITQWLEADEFVNDIYYCDGAGDGGIDIAYLHRADISEEGTIQEATEGDIWYLVQSKYGSAFRGDTTLLEEGAKVIDTLDGHRSNLSSVTQDLLQSLTFFRKGAGNLDKIILVFATEEPLSQSQRRTLDGIRAMGRDRLGDIFDVEAVSIETIYTRVLDEMITHNPNVKIPIHADLVDSGKGLLVGAIPLFNLYGFLKEYRSVVGDLDRLYEKNVRKFLGSRGKVNKAMQETLHKNPESFGLYNNGITIVVADFTYRKGIVTLIEPYIVNGCQTTKTIWEVFHQRTDFGGKGINVEIQSWKARAKKGVVVAKIVKVVNSDEALLKDITRYTNSQNAVREKDFLALTSDFKNMAIQMGERYNIYLETQRGGWESRKVHQKQHPDEKQYIEHTNIFDLIKVYGAGWLSEAGAAISRNAAFLPNGSVFNRIFNNSDDQFTVEDLYATYRVQQSADSYKFGRSSELQSRGPTRFLYYLVLLDILKGTMTLANLSTQSNNLTQALIKLYKPENQKAIQILTDVAINVIDEYMNPGGKESVFKEPKYQNNLISYLKSEQLGKSEEFSPNLRSLLEGYKRAIGIGPASPRKVILEAIM